MKSPSLVIPAAIAIGGLIIAFAIYLSVKPQESSTASGSGNPSAVRPVDSSDHILGNPTAPVTIVEYADYDCSYCKDFDSTLHQVIANDGTSGKVSWVFRNFPLTQLHPDAMSAAEAAECVAQSAGNDAYWKFADSLFANQPVAPTDYAEYAAAAGADPDTIANCEANASTTVDARINADSANATAVGAQGTPYSLILVAGRTPVVLDGAYPYDAVEDQITAALAQ